MKERRRKRGIPRFFSQKSGLGLVFSALWQASSRWQGVRTSEFELQQIALLRQKLGLGGSVWKAHVA